MFAIILAAIFLILGAMTRRWWGGWENTQSHFIKLVVCFGIAALSALFTLKSATASLVFGGLVLLTVMNFWHAKFQRMGNGGDPTLLQCLGGYALIYGLPTLCIGALLDFYFNEVGTITYGIGGCFVGLLYAAAWYVWQKLSLKPFLKTWPKPDGTPQYYFDGPTAIGENGIGAFVIGFLPLAKILSNLI